MTGVTGSLGSYVLGELLADPAVETVYCLCRANDDADAADRLAASMKARKLLTRFMGKRVVALAADLPAVRLGLEEERYREIVKRATVIIHVRFVIRHIQVLSFCLTRRLFQERLGGQFQFGHLQVGICIAHALTPTLTYITPVDTSRDNSFETHIRGAVNLMQLALSSPRSQPAKFFFSSSVSAVANWPGPGLVPEAVTDNPTVAQEMG